MSMRQICLDGRIGKDAETVTSNNGRKYVRFSVANNTYRNGEEKTEWFDVVSYDPYIIDNRVKYLTKGRYVIVHGDLDTVVSVKDGKVWLNQHVNANMIETPNFGTKKEDEQTQVSAEPAVVSVASLTTQNNNSMDDDSSDLPF